VVGIRSRIDENLLAPDCQRERESIGMTMSGDRKIAQRADVGDQANLNDKLPAYWLANLHTSYQLRKDLQIFAVINNLFNQKVVTSGTYFQPQSVANAGLPIALTDQRMQTPVQPLSIYVGLRAKL